MAGAAHEEIWPRLSAFVSERMGLHFPRERREDLERGIAGAAREFGFADAAACAGWLLATPPTPERLRVLARHLTVGETYFFRDPETLGVLAGETLPALIRARRGREQRLRIWSAACASGEEPYSLAILLHQLLPDLSDWQVTITATDINEYALRKAAAAVYGEWSFRAAPPEFRERYFRRRADGRFALLPAIARLVNFAHLNLAEDGYPSLATGTNAMDIVFCRNVLMYFEPSRIRAVVGKLHHALVEGGWLIVGPSEASQELFRNFFVAVNRPGTILYRKRGEGFAVEAGIPPDAPPAVRAEAERSAGPAAEPPAPPAPAPEPLTLAESLYAQGCYQDVADVLLAASAGRPSAPRVLSLLARASANRGDLDGALAWCERWIAADRLAPSPRYLRAVVLLERGDSEAARASLRRALYLDPRHVLAHFALGNLARTAGRPAEADRHFADALALLRAGPPEEILPDSDGLAAGRLAETIATMTAAERAA